MTQFLLNGKTTDHVELSDRGLQYGDGFFTTIRVQYGRLQLWSLHWQRLTECAERLGFSRFTEMCSETQLLANCQQLLQQQPDELPDVVIRISVTRGAGGRGYATPDHTKYNVILSLSPLPAHYASWREEGISLLVSHLRLGNQPMLNGLKTLNRLEQVLLKQDLAVQQRRYDIQDLLVLDQHSFVAECSAANIIWCVDDIWHTPKLSHGGVRGVAIQAISGVLPVEQGDYPLEHLCNAQHVMVCNALMGAVSVKRLMIDGTTERHFSVLSELSKQLTKRICANE